MQPNVEDLKAIAISGVSDERLKTIIWDCRNDAHTDLALAAAAELAHAVLALRAELKALKAKRT
jgi:hypothetical protein